MNPMNMSGQERIAVIGLGYVGLPLAMAFARRFERVWGYDTDPVRVSDLRGGNDRTGEITATSLAETSLTITNDAEELSTATTLIVAVPTPIDANKQPDLSYLQGASELVGAILQRRSEDAEPVLVVFESTVFPSATEEVCLPIIEARSGSKLGERFQLAYSPERINPGDPEHSLENVVKVVSGADDETLTRVSALYQGIIDAGVHRAPSIRVAEAAKVIENTQRDLNIALMNELAVIFDRLGISTRDVLAAAGTKWNFLSFHPGLVGGHCIGVDPYYLTAKAKVVGYHPEVILAGRRINDGMGRWVGQKAVKLLISSGTRVRGARAAVVGLTYKANVPDVRNSRVPDVIAELQEFGVEVLAYDPVADPQHLIAECGLELCDEEQLTELDALIVAVPHDELLERTVPRLIREHLAPSGVILDVMARINRAQIPATVTYWAL